MLGILKTKPLLCGLLLASTPVATWVLRAAQPAPKLPEIHTVSTPAGNAVQVPVEVVAKGAATKLVYVEMQTQAIPEPGPFALIALSSLLLLRRQRAGGK